MDGKEKRVKLTLKNISKSFYARKEIFEAVNNISIDVYENEFLVILGPGPVSYTHLDVYKRQELYRYHQGPGG